MEKRMLSHLKGHGEAHLLEDLAEVLAHVEMRVVVVNGQLVAALVPLLRLAAVVLQRAGRRRKRRRRADVRQAIGAQTPR